MADRFSRQADLVPAEKLAGTAVSVIGVGAIGRQVVTQLAAIGARRIQLFDFDQVDESNRTTQGYFASQVGISKVMACADTVREIDPDIVVTPVHDRWRVRYEPTPAIFCCVDDIQARATIWQRSESRCEFWADARMAGEHGRVLVVANGIGRDHYPTTLFAAAETHQGSCTARSTIYCASVAAALMVHQFTRWLRGIPVDRETTFNLLAGELVAV